MSIAASTHAAETWEKTIWNGEPAWAATHAGVRAVVTEARSRLIYFGAADGSLNLFNAPAVAGPPDASGSPPNWGGHRFWLGPQSRWVWPPPADWEHSAATKVEARGGVLVVHHPHLASSYPSLTREYAWEGARLRCTVRWADDGHPAFGMHVVAVDTPFAITVALAKTDQIPDGFVAARFVDPAPSHVLPHSAITLAGDHATVRAGIKSVKLGFVPQALTIDRSAGWKLTMHPGPAGGVAREAPDQGYLSQIWVGGPKDDLAELEQLTPFLAGDATGTCSSTIFLEATPPVASVSR